MSGMVIYGAMAACGGPTPHAAKGSVAAAGAPGLDGGQPSFGGEPAHSGAPGAGMMASAGTVPMAIAAEGGGPDCGCPAVEPKSPTITEVACAQVDGSPSTWAILQLPGMTDTDLARVTVVLDYSPEAAATFKWAPGFVSYASTVYVKNGAVATVCGAASSPGAQAIRARFIVP